MNNRRLAPMHPRDDGHRLEDRIYLSVRKAATIFGLREDTVRKWIGQGDLQAYLFGTDLRIDRRHLEDYIEGCVVVRR